MPPVIYCIRHGQGFHNVGAGCHTLPDPRLTPLGEEQNKALRETAFSDLSKISLVLASPLCRTLQSAYLVFQRALQGSSKCYPEIIAIPDAQETSDDPCDVGTDPSVLREVVTEHNWPVDLSLVQDGWNVKALGTCYSPESSAIAARARDARIFI
ncbi:phosphoglycerate mutase family [Fusarium globosum]|uniref:Phosphoglycerate mutase family n=1 Tax=Fusarium globosum TaxID=78864 RepID=A0A8H6CZC3_9HYPO|nr:phosphoglycerate mutase family [Fusarium globosum]